MKYSWIKFLIFQCLVIHGLCGSLVYFPEKIMNWADAMVFCQSQGMDLATLKNSSVMATAGQCISESGGFSGDVWIGAYFNTSDLTLRWRDDSILSPTHPEWDLGEPNNLNFEHGIRITPALKMRTMTCGNLYSFLCENDSFTSPNNCFLPTTTDTYPNTATEENVAVTLPTTTSLANATTTIDYPTRTLPTSGTLPELPTSFYTTTDKFPFSSDLLNKMSTQEVSTSASTVTSDDNMFSTSPTTLHLHKPTTSNLTSTTYTDQSITTDDYPTTNDFSTEGIDEITTSAPQSSKNITLETQNTLFGISLIELGIVSAIGLLVGCGSIVGVLFLGCRIRKFIKLSRNSSKRGRLSPKSVSTASEDTRMADVESPKATQPLSNQINLTESIANNMPTLPEFKSSQMALDF